MHVCLSVTTSTHTLFIRSLILFFRSYYCWKSLVRCRTQLCYSSLLTVPSAFVNKKWVYPICDVFLFLLLDLIPLYSVLEVIVITRKEIQKMLNLDTKMKLDFVCISDNMDMGTADSLRHIHQKIKVLLPSIELDWKTFVYNNYFFYCALRAVPCNDIAGNWISWSSEELNFVKVTSWGNSNKDSKWLELTARKAGADSGWALAAS